MWEKIAERLADWALATISALPPSQNLVAFFIVLALALPILSAGIRLFKRTDPQTVSPPVHHHDLAPDSLWVVTILTSLTTMGVQMQEVQRDIDGIERALGHISTEMSALVKMGERIERLLRSRSNKSRRRSLKQG